MIKKMKIKKGDKVRIIAGKDKGKSGKVEKVLPRKRKVLVEGVNIYKRHIRSRGKDQPGGIMEISKPLDISNVALICPQCNQSTRVGYFLDKEGKKYRRCKKCNKLISK